ncbi:MAG: carboxylate-amine ligase [Xanthobacteraceae bacterium]
MSKYSFGIEEEYFLVDQRTGGVKTRLSEKFMKSAGRELGSHLMTELLQSQIEVATSPLTCPREARAKLKTFRSTLAAIGREHRIAIMAAGTHPLCRPAQQRVTNKRRYAKMINELGMIALGNAICGLHVHVEVPDPDQRVGIMHRLVPFLPLLLALTTSSPFWACSETGLLGYRNAANDGFPRSGFPEMFRSSAEYEAYLEALVSANIIPDATYIWWAVRPSLRHPTLELRLTDSCTSINDAIAVAGLYRALVKHLVEHPEVNREYSALVRGLSEENRWRAQRYGTDGTYVDVRTREAKPFATLLDETLAHVSRDLDALGLTPEVEQLREIPMRGTSAHQQLRHYHELRKKGHSRVSALQAVVRWLCISTEAGDFVEPTFLSRAQGRSAVVEVALSKLAHSSGCDANSEQQRSNGTGGAICA